MSRNAATLDSGGEGPAALVIGVLLVLFLLFVGLVTVALQPTPGAESPPQGRAPDTVTPPSAHALIASPAPITQAPKALAAAAPIRPSPITPSGSAEMPYRFIGRSATGAEPSIVLFGRGRVFTVRGPQALDDEYAVEAVFDDYLVLRHVPTGAGKFLSLTQKLQAVGPPRDPEDAPRD